MQVRISSIEQFNCHMQIENAKLRAKNEMLEKQLNYFQGLFAKSAKSTASTSSKGRNRVGRSSGPFGPVKTTPANRNDE